MANWAITDLRVWIPRTSSNAFLEAVAGPQHYILPLTLHEPQAERHITEDEEARLAQDLERLEATFRAHPSRADYPA